MYLNVSGQQPVRCKQYRSGCCARGVIDGENFRSTYAIHNHTSDNEHISVLELRHRLLTAARTTTTPLRQLFDSICLDNNVAHLISFASMESTMRLHRRKQYPPLPLLIDELCLTLETNPFLFNIHGKNFFKCFVDAGEDGKCIVLSSDFLINVLRDSRQLVIDGTFKVVPSLFYQLVTIGAFKNGYVSKILLYIAFECYL